MPDNESRIREINERLSEIAPWPSWGSEATAASVARYLAVQAQAAFTMHITPFSSTAGGGRLDPVICAKINAQFAAAHALLALEKADPDAAKLAAEQITVAWNDGHGVGAWLWGHLGDGVSAEVAKLAEDLAAEAKDASDAEAVNPSA